jgi:DNA-binding CsgD family transcriptional regulator
VREEYFLELEEEGYVYVRGYDSSRYDPDWLETPTKAWTIQKERDDRNSYVELRDLFNAIRKGCTERLPREFTFDDGKEPVKETYLIDRNYDNYGNYFVIITGEEDQKSKVSEIPRFNTVRIERLLPYSIQIGHSGSLKFEFARHICRGRHVVETLLKETFPDTTFEWAKPYVPPPPPTPEEIRERKRQKRLERIKRTLTPLDYQILELRKQGLSYLGIARKLDETINKVRYTLTKMLQVPELWHGIPDKYKPLSREERHQLSESE